MKEPPFELDGGRVLLYTPIDRRRSPTGKADPGEGGRPPPTQALAIARNKFDTGFHLFYCDSEWRVQACTHHASLDAAREQAESEHPGTGQTWQEKRGGSVRRLPFEASEFDNLSPVSERVDAVIDAGCNRLVFNLNRVAFMNSSALAYLILTSKRLRELGGELVLSAPSKFFETTMHRLGLELIFKMFPDDDAALSYFDDSGDDCGGSTARREPRHPAGSPGPLPEADEDEHPQPHAPG